MMTENQPPQEQVPPPPPPQQYQYPPPPWWVKQPRPSLFRRIARFFFVAVFILSILMNIHLGMLLGGRMGRLSTRVVTSGDPKQQVAVFEISGMIDDRLAETFGLFYETVRDTDAIKAVVLRVDSGGGGIGASDRIHGLVVKIKNDLNKPVVVTMGSAAASGGYYVSAPADSIFAEPATITGSIGVIAMWPVINGLLDKIGVDVITMRSTDSQEWKARHFNAVEPPSEKVLADITKILDSFQARFESIVREGRGSRLNVNGEAPKGGQSPLNGQVFLADEALKLGLIDKIGYAGDAYALAAQLANLSRPQVTRYSRQAGLRDLFASEASAGLNLKALDPMASPRIMMLWRAQ
ncbi:MAG: S49 family peptidase [Planctomycetes bacterium]|nr:S49 family peptidase [Planctomycetota bacterium]